MDLVSSYNAKRYPLISDDNGFILSKSQSAICQQSNDHAFVAKVRLRAG